MRLNHERNFFSKIAETAHRASSTEAAYSEHSIAIHSIKITDNQLLDRLYEHCIHCKK